MKLSLKIPPPLIAFGAVLFLYALNNFAPLYRINFLYQSYLSISVVCIGTTIALIAIVKFKQLQTPIDPRQPDKTHRLANSGIYKISRNPMYLGILLILVGIGIYLGAVSGLLAIATFVTYITKYQIIPEEKVLTMKFKERYQKYSRNVPRWC